MKRKLLAVAVALAAMGVVQSAFADDWSDWLCAITGQCDSGAALQQGDNGSAGMDQGGGW